MNRHLWDIGDIPYFPGRITGISSRGLAEGVKGKLRAFSEPHLSIGTPGSGLPLRGENIRGHVFCGFLPLVLGKELDRGLEEAGHAFE
jgi:hypothetical protein